MDRPRRAGQYARRRGIPTTDGDKIIPGRLLRSDNLQTLTASDVDQLLGLGLTDVIDLRSDYEAEREGPGPLAGSDVRIHQFSLFREWESGVGETKPDVRPEVLPEEALPWIDLEPSVELDNQGCLGVLLLLGGSAGLGVGCAAYGRRSAGCGTGSLCRRQGPDRHHRRVGAIGCGRRAPSDHRRLRGELGACRAGRRQRLMASSTYAGNLEGRPISSHLSHPEAMISLLRYIDETFGGVLPMLTKMGWTADDTDQLRAKLRG